MNNKPFDLQKALDGEPLKFLESDFEVSEMFFSATRQNNRQQPIIVIAKNGNEYHYWEDGRRYKGAADPFDIVMAPKPVQYWVATGIHAEAGIIVAGRPAETSAQAVDYLSSISFVESDSIQTHKIIRYE